MLGMMTRSASARAKAPPLPPSPMIVATIGTRARERVVRQAAMASACARSSEPMPGSAPYVSTSVTMGSSKRVASSIRRFALR